MNLNLDFKNKNAAKEAAELEKAQKMKKKLAKTATYDAATLYAIYSSSEHGMDEEAVEDSRDEYGRNVVDRGDKVSVFKRIYKSFIV